MTVYQDGYTCPVCGPVTAKLWWSNTENDLVASCTICGKPIQRVIPAQPFSTPNLGHGGSGLLTNSGVSSDTPRAAPTPQEDTA